MGIIHLNGGWPIGRVVNLSMGNRFWALRMALDGGEVMVPLVNPV